MNETHDQEICFVVGNSGALDIRLKPSDVPAFLKNLLELGGEVRRIRELI